MATSALYDGIKVIDSDTHWSEPEDLWTSRAPAAYRDLVPQVKVVGGKRRWVVNGDTVIAPAHATSAIGPDGAKLYGLDFLGYTNADVHRACLDVDARLAMMDSLGIWGATLYPNVAGFGSQNFMKVTDEGLRVACVEIYNDYMAEVQAASGNRLLPMAMVPWWDAEGTAREMQRAKDLGLRGIVTCSNPHDSGFPDYAQSVWEPVWETAEGLELPINFHIGASQGDTDWFGRVPYPSWPGELKITIGGTSLFLGNARWMAKTIAGRWQALRLAKAVDSLRGSLVEDASRERRRFIAGGRRGQVAKLHKRRLQFGDIRSLEPAELAVSQTTVDGFVLSSQLCDRLGVLGNLQVHQDLRTILVHSPGIRDHERRRLREPLAFVAAHGLARLERRDEPIGQWPPGRRAALEVVGYRVDHGGAGEQIALHDIVLARAMARVVQALLPGELRRRAMRVDEAQLPRFAGRVVAEQLFERRRWRLPLAEQLERSRTIRDFHKRLRGDRAHAGFGKWAEAAYLGHARGDGHAGFARLRIERTNRKRMQGQGPRFIGRGRRQNQSPHDPHP